MSTSHSKKTLLKRTAKLEKELAVKSYGLKIESALEKVSIAAMSMRRSKDLSGIGSLIFKEIKKLGFTDLRNSEIIINNNAKETITSYYYSDYGVTGVIELDHKSNAIVKGWADQLKKASNAFAEVVILEKEMKAWRKYREEIGYLPDRKLNKAKTVYYYSYSTGHGALSISSFKPVSKEQIKILKRFRNVFQLSYQRYIDIAKAEAQTREAQIEAALERVRASSMAMHRSDELDKVIKEVTEQLTVLGFDFDASNITTDLTSEGLYVWNASPAQPIPSGVYIPYKDIYLINWLYSDWGIHEGVKTDTFNKAQKNAFFKHYFDHTDARNISDVRKKYILDAKSLNLTFACRKDFALGILNYRGIAYTEEENNILNRFSKVFGQSYTRFLDLQKAEAQAREAQIEAGLERVRSHAMAMRSSEELNALIGTVFTELTKLDLVLTRCVILIYEGNEKGVRWWMANSEAPSVPMNFFVKYADIPFFNEYLKAWQERSLKWQYILEGKNKFNTDEFLFKETELLQLPDFVIAGMRAPGRVYLNASFNNFGNLTLASLEPLSDEHFDILLRFAKVFDLTYTRFNDLKQAEEQARESKIQLALERVRARTMAMQKSEELAEVATLLFKQVSDLGIKTWTTGFNIWSDDNNYYEDWITSPQGGFIEPYTIDATKFPVFMEIAGARKSGKEFFVQYVEGEMLEETYRHLSKFGEKQFSQLLESGFQFPSRQFDHFVFGSKISLMFITYEPVPEAHDIFKRFGKVFEQTYTRFVDLQKAELQVRESQIQLALERVRARTMAMHKSEELAETAQVMFHQLQELGGIPDRIAIGVADEAEGVVNFWSTDQSGSHIDKSFKARLNERMVMSKTYQAWKDHKKSLVIDLQGDDVKEWIQFAREEMGVVVKDEFIKDRRIHNFAFFSHGWILVTTHEPQAAETIQILERFAAVFSLTYRRFLDLQKAEAQAREAQIEAALERVRARSMAMHHSSELHDAADVLFQQLRIFGGNIMNAGIALCTQDADEDEYWLSSDDGLRPVISIPHTEDSIQKKLYEDWKNKSEFYSIAKGGDELRAHYNYLRSIPKLKPFFEEGPDWLYPTWQKWHAAYFSHGYLFMITLEPYEEEKILVRFARVFEQAYTRFLDLQKAEAQAREAQIEAALERVRSKAMAMHISEDLGETNRSFYQQMRLLGLTPKRCGVGIIGAMERVSNLTSMYTTEEGESVAVEGKLLLKGHPMLEGVYQHFLEQKEYYPELRGNEIRDYYQLISPQISYPDYPQGEVQFGYFFFFPEGGVYAWTEKQMGESELNIYRRFTSVLSLTYKRYLDLQKAETQAKEAQIEASLERVRSKAMAMHNSADLSSAASVVFTELKKLGIRTIRSGISLQNKENRKNLLYTSTSTDKEENLSLIGWAILDDHPVLKEIHDSWMRGEDYFPMLKGDELKSYYEKIKSTFTVPAAQSQDYEQHGYFMAFTQGMFYGWAEKPFDDNEKNILKRFASVVDLTFKRYFDLQKAEGNAREAQIETSLERVRSKTMAMHNSNDVGETVAAMFAEFVYLGIHTNRCGILIFNDQYTTEVWTARSTPGGNAKLIIGKLDLDAHKMLRFLYNAWKAKETFYQYDLLDDDLVQYYTAINNSKFYPTQFDLDALPSKEFNSVFFFADGAVFSFTNEPVIEEHAKIIKRFALVFGQTYRRYLDLQKAEAQTREAQIEAGLERVRARTMAMHSSEDVSIATATMFTELEKLGVENFRGGITNILTNRTQDVWSVSNLAEEKVLKAVGAFDIDAHPFWQLIFKEWEAKKDFLHYFLAGQEKEDYIKILNATQGYLPQAIQQFPDVHFQVYYFNEGGIWTNSLQPHSEEDKQVMKRFTSVFSLTFRRYQDLKKAEAQAKEAQIETSLERVRSKTMAMHSSDDVTSATATMFTELERLGIENMRCGIAHYLEDHKMEVWSVSNLADGKVVRGAGLLDTNSIPFWKIFYSTWQKKEDFLYYSMAGKEKEDYFKKISTLQNYLSQSIEDVPDLSIQTYYFPEGSVWAFSLKPHSEEDKQVMKRFASVFSLTFRRYQDLKRAEAQAREATIEAALEKVRGKAMAMHNSNDLSVTASLVFAELRKLGINPIRCGVGLLNKESRKGQLYSATSSPDGDSLSLVGWVILSEHPVLEKIYESWLDNEEYYPELQGEQMRSYYQLLLKGLPVAAPKIEDDKIQYGNFLPFSVGCLYAWSEIPYNDTEIKILKRFATIIDLTFRRYIELQTSEANAREAVKQAAVDRIRADIASMRTISDLDRITPLIWNELTILGINFIRCGVFIMDNSQQLIHTFLSTPDGKAIGAFHLPYDTPGNFSVMLKHWLDKETYISRWDEVDFIAIAEILVQQGSIPSREQYLNSLPKSGFYLHFLPFLQGMLYVGNTTQLGEEEIELIQHVADAFSTAYARYEDFNKLEAAKQQVERTLTDLKQAQAQLVQSEKMASLGELTAGIAHEIQNPLNFVNNFSDVSNELLDEMKEELAKGNIGDAIAIAEDVKQNLEKINHHGKRADGIVKGMLQHSRTSSGQKEITDINILADEYLRLAYHGLRAKDKSFNAKFETRFDNSVGKVNIIPQEIGRVILNLINNAFYTVTEKKKRMQAGYDPTVTVTTKRENGRIEIAVLDNGNGISQKNLDKIFQPFFTTKPTGQGTGLGLSLAYDILKSHGGDIRVETKEGEGSEFIIQLPV